MYTTRCTWSSLSWRHIYHRISTGMLWAMQMTTWLTRGSATSLAYLHTLIGGWWPKPWIRSRLLLRDAYWVPACLQHGRCQTQRFFPDVIYENDDQQQSLCRFYQARWPGGKRGLENIPPGQVWEVCPTWGGEAEWQHQNVLLGHPWSISWDTKRHSRFQNRLRWIETVLGQCPRCHQLSYHWRSSAIRMSWCTRTLNSTSWVERASAWLQKICWSQSAAWWIIAIRSYSQRMTKLWAPTMASIWPSHHQMLPMTHVKRALSIYWACWRTSLGVFLSHHCISRPGPYESHWLLIVKFPFLSLAHRQGTICRISQCGHFPGIIWYAHHAPATVINLTTETARCPFHFAPACVRNRKLRKVWHKIIYPHTNINDFTENMIIYPCWDQG